MKIALLGYGVEGQATAKYLKQHFADAEIDIFENLTPEAIIKKDYSSYDIIFRSPSIPPLHLPNESSVTKYFFEHCPCQIIGVTATKGKGTTCSFIRALLDAHHEDVYLVGNIGEPAINILDQLSENSVVVYEMSSFQLWDLHQSPHIAVVGHLEPDHLNVHNGYDDYLAAKANICRFQTPDDYCIYYQDHPTSREIAALSPAHQIPYPFTLPSAISEAITLPGDHNRRNAMAAIAAVASYKNISPDEYLQQFPEIIQAGLASFHGLPHRLEFLRELDGIKYYDDNFSTNPSSTRVAIESFPANDVVIIVGGRDKTGDQDLPEIYEILKSPNIKKIILLGESGRALANKYQDSRFEVATSLDEAVTTARQSAAELDSPVVLMSPAAASFDMFKDVYDRGAQYQRLVKSLS